MKAPIDPRLSMAQARLEAIELADAEEAAQRAELDRQGQEREAARAVAVAELAEAAAEAEAEQLSRAIPIAAEDLKALGGTMRGAFALVAETMPQLLAAQSRYDELRHRADRLLRYKALRVLPHAPALGGIDRKVCELLAFAVAAQGGIK